MITANYIIERLNQYGINNKLEQAYFLGQCDHESGGFTKFGENLNYSAEALLKLWPKRFTKELAYKYGRTAEHPADQRMIANIAYGSRMGNELDGTNDDDGFEYRGGGLIQLTGEGLYALFLKWLQSKGQYSNLTIDTVDDFVRSEEGAVISAIWYWQYKGCGKSALADDIVVNTKAINGGTIGLEDEKGKLGRRSMVAKYKKLLGC